MIKTQQTLSEKEKKELRNLYRSALANKWVGLVLTGFSGYISYLFIRLVYDEIRTSPYDIRHAEILDLGLLVLFFGFLGFIMLGLAVFAFRRMFLSYRKRATLFKKDLQYGKKEIVRGWLIGSEVRKQGFCLKFENNEEVEVDFNYLITGGYKIIQATLLTHTEVEVITLPNSFLSYGIRYINFPEQKQERRYGAETQHSVSGVVTFAFLFEIGLKFRYKGIPLDRPQMLLQIGNHPIRLPAKELPVPGVQIQQPLQDYMQIKL